MSQIIRLSLCLFVVFSISISSCEKGGSPPNAIFRYFPDEANRHYVFHFDAAETYDSDNPEISLKYRWEFTGDSVFETDFSELSYASYLYPQAGVYWVTLEVKDPEGNIGCCHEKVTVSSRNSVPMADLAVLPPMGSLSTIVSLDARNSFDWEELTDSLWFRFDVDGDGIWETDYVQQPVFQTVYSTAGIYPIKMEVKDSDGDSDVAFRQIEIVDTYNEFGYITDYRDGEVYGTVKINSTWVMAENLRFGQVVSTSATPLNNGLCEVFAYDDIVMNRGQYGAMYLWGELMEYSTKPDIQGVCPDGWHVPTDQEWSEFERGLGIPYEELETTGWERGQGAGSKLLSGSKSGFNAGLYGFRLPYRLFSNFGNESYYWTSTMLEDGSVWIRGLANKSSGIFRGNYRNNYGFYVRCFIDD